MHAQSAAKQSDIKPIRTGAEYIESLRNRKLKVYLFGELVDEPVDHPIIRPSINAVAETYDLAVRNPELATAASSFTGERVNRFLHIARSPEDLVMQNKMQRRLGQLTGTCFQRCVGMDALNSLHSVTYEMDEKYGTAYHQRFTDFVAMAQRANFVIGGAMTDVKGDRSKAPSEQADPGPVRARHRAHGQGHHHQGRQSAPDRLPELALADRDADHAAQAPPTRTTRSWARCPSTRRASPTSMAASPATRAARTRAASTPATPASPARKR